MAGVYVPQEGFFFCEFLVTVGTEDGLQLQMYRSEVSVQVTCRTNFERREERGVGREMMRTSCEIRYEEHKMRRCENGTNPSDRILLNTGGRRKASLYYETSDG